MSEYDGITMLTYVEKTPARIQASAANAAQLTGSLVDAFLARGYRAIWIIACGSSANAGWCARPFMRSCLGIDVEVVSPSAFIFSDFVPSEDTLCFVVSQSGCSTNSIAALDRLRELGRPTIGLTGNVDSDFRDHSDLLVDYGVGVEVVGYVTKGVVALAEFLMLFAAEAALGKKTLSVERHARIYRELDIIPDLHREVQKRTNEFYEKRFKEMTSITVHYALGFDQAYGIATEAALKFGETMKVPSFAFDAEEYNHGPNLQLTPNYTVMFVDDMSKGSNRLIQLYHATRVITDEAFLLTDRDSAGDVNIFQLPTAGLEEPLLSPLYVLPFFQIIAYRATSDLGRWGGYPLTKAYREAAPSKTEAIDRVMPLS